jgi:hypothetical protein
METANDSVNICRGACNQVQYSCIYNKDRVDLFQGDTIARHVKFRGFVSYEYIAF